MSEPSPFQLMINPEKYGFTQCGHCNGYGSSLKEEADRCTECEGLGLVPMKKEGKSD